MDLRAHLAQLVSQRSSNKTEKATNSTMGNQPQPAKQHQPEVQETDQQQQQQQGKETRGRPGKQSWEEEEEALLTRKKRTRSGYHNRSPSRPFGCSLIGLSWSTRLTIILVGTCILFTLFFALEFFIAKLASHLEAKSEPIVGSHGWRPQQQQPGEPPIIQHTTATADRCSVESRLSWAHWTTGNAPPLSPHSNNSRQQQVASSSAIIVDDSYSADRQAKVFDEDGGGGARPPRRPHSKLGVDFDLIYEEELTLSDDERHYVFAGQKHPVRPDYKLLRLFEAYQLAMPFHPDIWRLSEPENQMHLFWGQLDKCSQDLEEILERVEQFRTGADKQAPPMSQSGIQHYRLMQLLDSFGRPESGTLLGHPFWLGSYLQCQLVGSTKVRTPLWLERPQRRRLETRYCVGKLAFADSGTTTRAEERLRQQEVHTIKLGLCLPKSCDSLDLFKHHYANQSASLEAVEKMRQQVESLALQNVVQTLYPRGQFHLVDIYCLPLEETRQLGAGAWVLILLAIVWLCACALFTWIRRQKSRGQQRQLLEISQPLLDALAIDVNLDEFLASPTNGHSNGRRIVDLSVLDSVKHLGCMGVIAAHVLLTYLTLGTAYSHVVEHIGKDMRTMLLLSLNNIVDTFFVISGLLVAYFMFKKLDRKTSGGGTRNGDGNNRRSPWWSQYAQVVTGRYLRMAPLYLLVYAWIKLLSVHVGSGPLWDYATNKDSLRGLCQRESWLWPIAFASDFKPLTHHCVPPAWSIAADLQYFLVLPLFIALLRRSQRLGYSVLGALIVASTAYTLADYESLLEYVSLADFAKLHMHVFTILITHATHAYSQPQNRVGPMLIGLVGGHMLYEYEKRVGRRQQQQQQQQKQRQQFPIEIGTTNKEEKEEEATSVTVQADHWPWWMRGGCFGAVVVYGVLFMLAPNLVQLRERARLAEARALAAGGADWWGPWLTNWALALYTSERFDCYLAIGGFVLIKPLWSICNCILFLRLATDLRPTILGRLMSLHWWRSLSKLNFAILLVHFEFLAFEAMMRLSLGPITWTGLVCKFAFAYLCSLLVALPLYVLFEQPVHRLTSWWLLGRECPPATTSNEPELVGADSERAT